MQTKAVRARSRPARVVIARRLVCAAVLVAVLLLALAEVAPEAQELVRILGSVQWVAGARMQVMTDSGASIAVDLTQADQSTYQALRGGEAVVVDGFLSVRSPADRCA
jgi:hypothetical protein